MKVNVKKIRDDLILTQEQFAKILEVNRSTVYSWEHGFSNPQTQTLKKIQLLCKGNKLNWKDYANN